MSATRDNLKLASAPRPPAPSPAARFYAARGRRGLRGVAVGYLLVMVALPLSAIFANGLSGGISGFWEDVRNPVAVKALTLTLTAALVVTVINALMGTLTAYALVRIRFPGRNLLNAVIDMPFAIPTLVTGVMLVSLYGPQRTLGAWLNAHGVKVIFAEPGIVLALLVVTYPFVIRAVQPVLLEVELGQEEAAYTIGASKWKTFVYVLLPTIMPAIITGSLLTFGRALGEFGSIVVVAGNIPGQTLTAPVYIYGQIESSQQRGASSMSIVLLALSFALILLADRVQSRRRRGHDTG